MMDVYIQVHIQKIYSDILESILGRDHLNAKFVGRNLIVPTNTKFMNDITQE